MQLAAEVFRRLDIAVVVKWNNRRFLGEILESAGVPAQEHLSVMLTLDKLAKIGIGGVLAELSDKGLTPEALLAITALLESGNPGFEELTRKYGLAGRPGALEVLALKQLIEEIGLDSFCVFDPFLSRGLSFYTGTVYEIFDASGVYTSSLGGGEDMIPSLESWSEERISNTLRSAFHLAWSRSWPCLESVRCRRSRLEYGSFPLAGICLRSCSPLQGCGPQASA